MVRYGGGSPPDTSQLGTKAVFMFSFNSTLWSEATGLKTTKKARLLFEMSVVEVQKIGQYGSQPGGRGGS